MKPIKNFKPEKCPRCGRPLEIRYGEYGTYLDCTGYPKCRYTKDISTTNSSKTGRNVIRSESSVPDSCPKCGKKLALYKGDFGIFLGCIGYPKCRFSYSFEDPTIICCPECGKNMVERIGEYGLFYGCSGYPECKFTFDLRIKEKESNKPKKMLILNNKVLKSKIDKVTIIKRGNIIFCPQCDNMLRSITEPSGNLIYYCKYCNIRYENII
jgi:ssDNA-binding Zn-finger/Zn-ribbon topoisomerase 1